MSRTTGRTMQLLSLLQSGRGWSGAELRERLGVSDRTLRRDVDDLRSLGYGIDAARGVGGGYRLGAGAAIPPLTLSPEEAVAIAVGLRAAAVGAVTGLEDAAAAALAKLEQSLSAETRERIAAVEQAILPLEAGSGGIGLDVVVTVARAIRESRRLRVGYTRHDGERVRRSIEPHRMLQTADHWYLVAWDVDRESWRTLRVDRLTPTLPLGPRFRPRSIPADQLRRFTSQSIAVSPWPHRAVLHVRAPAEEVRRHFDAGVAQVDELPGGGARLETGAKSWDELAYWVGRTGLEFDVVEGDGLREALRRAADRLRRAAGPE